MAVFEMVFADLAAHVAESHPDEQPDEVAEGSD
jgi:hypothetical protein